MEVYDFKEARRYAMQLGLQASLFWIGSFLLFAYTFPSFLSELSMLIGLASAWYVGMKVKRRRQEDRALNGLRCWSLTWLTFICTVLLTTIVQYFYFAVLDGGMMLAKLDQMFSSPQIVELYRQSQATDMLEQLQVSIHEMQSLTVRELMMSFMTTNLLLGFIFSLLSLLCIIGTKAGQKRRNV